jgi:hypothetical protein
MMTMVTMVTMVTTVVTVAMEVTATVRLGRWSLRRMMTLASS